MAGPVRLRRDGLLHRWWRFTEAEPDLCDFAKKTLQIGTAFVFLAALLGLCVWALVIAPILKFGWAVYLRWAAVVVGILAIFVGACVGVSRMREDDVGQVVVPLPLSGTVAQAQFIRNSQTFPAKSVMP